MDYVNGLAVVVDRHPVVLRRCEQLLEVIVGRMQDVATSTDSVDLTIEYQYFNLLAIDSHFISEISGSFLLTLCHPSPTGA